MPGIFEDNGRSVGNTSLVRLARIAKELPVTSVAKIEGRNPAYSVRVCDHDPIARIESARRALDRALEYSSRQSSIQGCRRPGYRYLCLDLEGHCTGSTNEILAPAVEAQ